MHTNTTSILDYDKHSHHGITEILHNAPCELFLHQSDCRDFTVLCSTGMIELPKLREYLSSYPGQIIDINTPRFRGILYIRDSCESVLIITPKPSILTTDQKILNDSIEAHLTTELRIFGKKHNIIPLTRFKESTAYLLGINMTIAKSLNIFPIQLLNIKFLNSQNEYLRHYRNFNENKNVFEYSANQNFTEIDSWVYSIEINTIIDLCPSAALSLNEIIDGISSHGHFSLLAASLSATDNSTLNISKGSIQCINKNQIFGKFIKKAISSGAYNSIRYSELNIEDICASEQTHDISVINNVFENISDDITSVKLLRAIWDNTANMLVIHFWDNNGLSDQTNDSYGISGNIIRAFQELPGATSIAHELFYDTKPLSEIGFMIAVKKDDPR